MHRWTTRTANDRGPDVEDSHQSLTCYYIQNIRRCLRAKVVVALRRRAAPADRPASFQLSLSRAAFPTCITQRVPLVPHRVQQYSSRVVSKNRLITPECAMQLRTGDKTTDRKSLTSTNRDYKKDTQYSAGWLAATSKRCGYASTEQPKTSRPKGQARKNAKTTKALSVYTIKVSEFIAMAHSIASFEPKVEVPAALQRVFD